MDAIESYVDRIMADSLSKGHLQPYHDRGLPRLRLTTAGEQYLSDQIDRAVADGLATEIQIEDAVEAALNAYSVGAALPPSPAAAPPPPRRFQIVMWMPELKLIVFFPERVDVPLGVVLIVAALIGGAITALVST